MPACLFALFLALALTSCSSDTEQAQSSPEEDGNVLTPKHSDEGFGTALVVDEDDNRSNLEPCGLIAQGIDATSVTVTWSEPANASSKPFYRLEVAEDEDFTKGYLSFPKLTETRYDISDLKINAGYHFKLQAFLGPEDDTFAPSEAEFAQASTNKNALLAPTNLQLTIDYGKFSAKWDPPSNASGKLEHIVTLYADESLNQAWEHRLVKKSMVEDWFVTADQDYWIEVRALPDTSSANERDTDSQTLVKQFYVPGNQLRSPKNFKITSTEDMIHLSWDPINENKQNFEYLLYVYLDETRLDCFGEYHLDEPKTLISGVNQNSRYWFDLQAVPVTGNHADTPSETISSSLELPSITYENPRISKLELEPIDDPGTPGTLVLLSWDKTNNGDGRQKYWVEIADDQNFEGGLQEFESEASAAFGDYGPLLPGRTYYLRMRVNAPDEDATRNSSEWSEIRTIVTPPAPPSTPIE